MSENKTRDIAAYLRERVVPAAGSRHGLVIGIEQYRDARLNLRCAAADARAIYDLMTDPECGMFPKDNVRLLLDGEATRDGIWRSLSALRRNAGEHDTVWIYYAGHAAPEDAQVYWVPQDADVDDLYGTGLGSDQLTNALNDIRAEKLLVLLDCCHAAATAAQRNPTRATLTADEVFACYRGKGRLTLTSSDGKEKSVELSDAGHGAFTYFLEKGLRGEADTDKDGVVTADELWRYLRSKVVAASQKVGNVQTPVLIGEMRHDLALSLNPLAVGEKRRLMEKVASLAGLGADRLSTGEAEVCLEILKRPPATPQAKTLMQELHKCIDGQANVALLKVLIASAGTDLFKTQSPVARAASVPATQNEGHPGPQGTGAEYEPLVRAYLEKLNASDADIRVEGARSLALLGAPAASALASLASLLNDTDMKVRKACGSAIKSIGFAGVCLEGVKKALESDDRTVKLDTLELLRQCGTAASGAMPDILKLFSDPDRYVRNAAETAYSSTSGKVVQVGDGGQPTLTDTLKTAAEKTYSLLRGKKIHPDISQIHLPQSTRCDSETVYPGIHSEKPQHPINSELLKKMEQSKKLKQRLDKLENTKNKLKNYLIVEIILMIILPFFAFILFEDMETYQEWTIGILGIISLLFFLTLLYSLCVLAYEDRINRRILALLKILHYTD